MAVWSSVPAPEGMYQHCVAPTHVSIGQFPLPAVFVSILGIWPSRPGCTPDSSYKILRFSVSSWSPSSHFQTASSHSFPPADLSQSVTEDKKCHYKFSSYTLIAGNVLLSCMLQFAENRRSLQGYLQFNSNFQFVLGLLK